MKTALLFATLTVCFFMTNNAEARKRLIPCHIEVIHDSSGNPHYYEVCGTYGKSETKTEISAEEANQK